MWVGSPKPQRQSVIVDTGSHHTAFPCKECSNCGESYHTDNYFDWSKSTTFHPLTCSECEPGASCAGDKCQFSQSYTEGSSWHAYQVKDQFFCGGNEPDAWNNPIDRSYAIDFTFGCQTSETVSYGYVNNESIHRTAKSGRTFLSLFLLPSLFLIFYFLAIHKLFDSGTIH